MTTDMTHRIKARLDITVGDGGEKFVSLTDKQQCDAWLSLAIRGMHAPETLRRATGYADGV